MLYWLGRANDLLWRDDQALAWYDRAVLAGDPDGRARFRRARVRVRQYLESLDGKDDAAEIVRDRLKNEIKADLDEAERHLQVKSERDLSECTVLVASREFEKLREKCASRRKLGGSPRRVRPAARGGGAVGRPRRGRHRPHRRRDSIASETRDGLLHPRLGPPQPG
jgi:hypothetical protein